MSREINSVWERSSHTIGTNNREISFRAQGGGPVLVCTQGRHRRVKAWSRCLSLGELSTPTPHAVCLSVCLSAAACVPVTRPDRCEPLRSALFVRRARHKTMPQSLTPSPVAQGIGTPERSSLVPRCEALVSCLDHAVLFQDADCLVDTSHTW